MANKEIKAFPEETTPVAADLYLIQKSSNDQTSKVQGTNIVPANTITPEKLVTGAGTSWAWQTWSPTYTAIAVNSGTVTANYVQVGKTIHFFWKLVCAADTSIASGQTISLPVTANADYNSNFSVIGQCSVYDASPAAIVGGWTFIHNSTTNATVRWNDGVQNLDNGFPLTEAVNDVFTISGTYEAA